MFGLAIPYRHPNPPVTLPPTHRAGRGDSLTGFAAQPLLSRQARVGIRDKASRSVRARVLARFLGPGEASTPVVDRLCDPTPEGASQAEADVRGQAKVRVPQRVGKAPDPFP